MRILTALKLQEESQSFSSFTVVTAPLVLQSIEFGTAKSDGTVKYFFITFSDLMCSFKPKCCRNSGPVMSANRLIPIKKVDWPFLNFSL